MVLKIEGVVGITLDDEDVFIVHIDEGLTADLNRTTRHASTVTSTDEFTGIKSIKIVVHWFYLVSFQEVYD